MLGFTIGWEFDILFIVGVEVLSLMGGAMLVVVWLVGSVAIFGPITMLVSALSLACHP